MADTVLLVQIDAFLRIVLGPTYLHDQAVDQVCPELERNGGAFAAAYARQASVVDPGWLAEMLQVNSSDIVVDKRNDPLLFFWGAKGSVAYPLHWDVVDGDNFMQATDNTAYSSHHRSAITTTANTLLTLVIALRLV